MQLQIDDFANAGSPVTSNWGGLKPFLHRCSNASSSVRGVLQQHRRLMRRPVLPILVISPTFYPSMQTRLRCRLELLWNCSRQGAHIFSPLQAATHSFIYIRFSTQTGARYGGQRHGSFIGPADIARESMNARTEWLTTDIPLG